MGVREKEVKPAEDNCVVLIFNKAWGSISLTKGEGTVLIEKLGQQYEGANATAKSVEVNWDHWEESAIPQHRAHTDIPSGNPMS